MRPSSTRPPLAPLAPRAEGAAQGAPTLTLASLLTRASGENVRPVGEAELRGLNLQLRGASRLELEQAVVRALSSRGAALQQFGSDALIRCLEAMQRSNHELPATLQVPGHGPELSLREAYQMQQALASGSAQLAELIKQNGGRSRAQSRAAEARIEGLAQVRHAVQQAEAMFGRRYHRAVERAGAALVAHVGEALLAGRSAEWWSELPDRLKDAVLAANAVQQRAGLRGQNMVGYAHLLQRDGNRYLPLHSCADAMRKKLRQVDADHHNGEDCGTRILRMLTSSDAQSALGSLAYGENNETMKVMYFKRAEGERLLLGQTPSENVLLHYSSKHPNKAFGRITQVHLEEAQKALQGMLVSIEVC